MSSEPVSRHSGRDEDPRPAGGWPEWMDDPAYLALRTAGEDLDDPDLVEDPGDASLPEVDDGELAAEADRVTGELAREAVLLARLGLTGSVAADAAALAGRRGPGMPGSAGRVAGISVSRAAGFASGMPLDTAAGCLELARFAEDAAGPDDRYRDATDDELAGVICAWERSGAYISARKHAAVAEFIRRRPAPGCQARVERWAEDSGNAGLAGRELPPAQVLAADQRVTAWAKELKQAGLAGGMDALRARAFLDILLGMDSRPLRNRAEGTGAGTPRTSLSPALRMRIRPGPASRARRAGRWPG